jgi:hypothetical protein
MFKQSKTKAKVLSAVIILKDFVITKKSVIMFYKKSL